MGKLSRKRQKTEKSVRELVEPLGTRVSLTDDASKDDEERRLESLLFGIPFVPSTKDTILMVPDGEEGQEELADGGKELENMLDADVSDCNGFSPCSSGVLKLQKKRFSMWMMELRLL
jgi:U3 small nucleolar RNA-associated protein 18